MAKKKMTEKEKKEFETLYEYVRKNIMGYDNNQSLSRQMVLRLKGLSTNKFIENKNIKDTANYSYETILNAFKFSSPIILKAFKNGSFADEMHKFNLALKIVEPKINDIYARTKNIEKAKEEVKKVDMTIATYNGVKYKSEDNPEKKTKTKFEDLW